MLPNPGYAFRMMRKSPGFTAVAVLTLALGIGANTAIFSAVNALLLRPLPLLHPDGLVAMSASDPQRGIPRGGGFSLASYETLRDRGRSFAGIAAWCGDSFTLTGAGDPEQLAAARVSPNFFEVLDAPPFLGRGFRSAEGEAGGRPVAVISAGLWQSRFASDPAILGKTLSLNQEVYTVIGVMPPGFPFPFTGADVWVTRLMKYPVFQPEQIRSGAGYLTAIARLKPGVPIERAEAETEVLNRQYRREHPSAPDADPNRRLAIEPLHETLTAGIRQTLWVLAAAVGLVLLIACANVASLMLARATGRAKEIALRTALGASRGAIIRQLLAESVLLSVAGAVMGGFMAWWGVDALVRADTAGNLPGFQPIRIDLTALAFTLAVSLLTAIAFGLAPALQVSRPDLNAVLRDGGWGTTGGARRHRARSLLVAGQAALSVVLLIGAGLLVESFRQLQSVSPGFDPSHGLTMSVAMSPAKYPDAGRRTRFLHDVLDRLGRTPGVKSASASLGLPLVTRVMSPVLAEGQSVVPPAQRPLAQWNSVTPEYFQTLGIPLLRGRDFTWADDEESPLVLIVSESLARRFWPNQNPLGKHVTFTRLQTPFEIVGVAADVKTRGLAAGSDMVIYSVYPQWTWPAMAVTIRTAGNPAPFANAARAQVFAVDRDQPVTGVQTLEDLVANSLSQQRQTMYLIAGFALLALVLAAVGLYGVMAYSVAQRTAEFGIRQAIGAQPADILRMVLGQGLRLGALGVAVGVGAAAALTRLISGMLFHTSATDPLTFAGIAVLFLAVVLAASGIPAWRATRADPLDALRHGAPR